MKVVKMPGFLQDVLGTSQHRGELMIAGMGTVVLGSALSPFLFTAIEGLEWWRCILAAVLVLDIVAGCLANFTYGTNRYYAARPVNRLVFITIHIHLPLVGFLMEQELVPFLVIWAWTIAGALIVNSRHGRNDQPVLGGTLLAGGLVVVGLLPGMNLSLRVVAALFLLKVLYSFAVDHYATQRAGKEPDKDSESQS